MIERRRPVGVASCRYASRREDVAIVYADAGSRPAENSGVAR